MVRKRTNPGVGRNTWPAWVAVCRKTGRFLCGSVVLGKDTNVKGDKSARDKVRDFMRNYGWPELRKATLTLTPPPPKSRGKKQ